jgi:Lipopolysaccharide kinase (Kdo/WaaP) family
MGEGRPIDGERSADTLWVRLARGARRLHQRADWHAFAGHNWPDQIMAAAVTDRFHAKQGRTTGRWVLEAGGRHLTVYLKRHYRLPWWQGLLATLWPERGWSPALQEWLHLGWARDQGMPVPNRVAAGEYIGPWGRLRSFLAVEELTGMLPLHEAIPAAAAHLDACSFAAWKRGLTRELARVTRALHERRYFHKDLYLCHFYIPENAVRGMSPHSIRWPGLVHLIDLHRLARHPWSWRWWQAKDLAQLLYSSEIEGVTARDRLRFGRIYFGPRRQTRQKWWVRKLILMKWQRYRRHNAKKKGSEVRGQGSGVGNGRAAPNRP